MLTTNKAVYGTDGSLSTLGNIKGSGGGGSHTHEPIFESERITNADHDTIHFWNVPLGDFSFNDTEYDGKFLLIVADVTSGGDTHQYTAILPPNKSMSDPNYLQIGQVVSGGVDGMIVCDDDSLEFYTYKTYDPDASGYIDDFKIYIYLM